MSDNFKYAQLQKFSLAGSGVSITDTSMVLQSFQSIDGVPLTMSDFGIRGFGTVEPGSSNREEQIVFTGITQNGDGTATLTGVSNVDFLFPYTETSGFQKSHPGGVVFIISNTSGFYDELTSKDNDETINGVYTFNAVPNTISDPVGGNDLTRRSWVLSQINGGPVSMDALVVNGVAGETVSAGQILYLKVADGRWWKASSATSATTDLLQLSIAQGSGTAGVSITDGVLLRGVDTHQSGLTTGTIYYLSTGGAISSSAGTVERAIGQGFTSTSLYFDPEFFYIPTATQKGAFAGSNGVPSSTNKFLTQQAVLSTTTDQTQLVQDTLTAVGEANATGKHNLLAQSFIAGVASTRGTTLFKSADTGTFTGTVTVSLQADTSGSPSGANLSSVIITNAAWILIPTGAFESQFSAEVATTVGTTYWIVVTTSTSDNANHPNLGANSAGGYASGVSKYHNGTDGWVTNGALDLYFATLVGTLNKVAGTSGTEGLVLPIVSRYALVELNNTQTSLASSTTETTVYTKLLPAGFFNATTGIKLAGLATIALRIVSSASKTITIRVKLDGTTVSTMVVAVSNSGGTAIVDPMKGRWETEIVNATLSSQVVANSFTFTNTTWAATGDATVTNVYAMTSGYNTSTSSVDTSIPVVLTITYQASESNADTGFTHDSVLVEKIG